MVKKAHHRSITRYALTSLSALGVLAAAQVANADQVVVKNGDTVWSIAKQHGLTTQALENVNPKAIKKLNNSIDLIYAGQQLSLSQQTETASDQADIANGTHVVAPGETLSQLAARFHVSVNELMVWNHLSSDQLYIGQRLAIAGPALGDTVAIPTTVTPTSAIETPTSVSQSASTVTVSEPASAPASVAATASQTTVASSAPASAPVTDQASTQVTVNQPASATTDQSSTSVAPALASQTDNGQQATTSSVAQPTSLASQVSSSASTSSITNVASQASQSATATPTVTAQNSVTSDQGQNSVTPVESTASQSNTVTTEEFTVPSQSSANTTSIAASQLTASAYQTTAPATSQVPASQSTSASQVPASQSTAVQQVASQTPTSQTNMATTTSTQSSVSQSASAQAVTSAPASAAATSSAAQSQSSASTNLQQGSVVSLAVKIANSNSVPYVWGGSTLSGMDCSGLVDYVYANAEGKQLPHNTVALESYVSQHSVSEAQSGDILFWGSHGSTYHCAIYIGNNQFVAAAKPGTNVAVYSISPYFEPSFAGTVK